MNTNWQAILRSAWDELARHDPQSRQFRTKRLSATDAASAYAGMRAIDNAPCLLIEGSINPSMLFEVGGMRLGAYQGESGALLALTLEDRGQSELFLVVCADVAWSASIGTADGYLTRFLARLDAWRGFLRERRAGLTKNETVGLIGELLMLERLLAISQDMLLSWVSPDDGLHDFNWRGHALEIKTAMGPASRLRVSALDQLDPGGLNCLTLIHTRINETADGRCLREILQDVNTLVADESSRRFFSNALLKRGLMPDDQSAFEYPLIEERETVAYRVGNDFPKLIRASVPTAIVEAEYSLELRSIATYSTPLDVELRAFSGRTP